MIKTNIVILLTALVSLSITSCKDVNGLPESTDNKRLQLYAEEKSSEETLKNDVKEVKSGPVDFTETAKKVLDAVVHIRSTQASSNRNSDILPRELPDFFRDFFGDRFQKPENMPQQPMYGSGSGVIIDEEGHIVTNNHVINNATELEVTLHDNETYKATVIGTDPTTDIALLQIKG
ncbi:MAG: trypsin-like peptidase domain-containing protein, partial [Maribacter sp.]|nr:trypsin-like peptidase domain-containing protein [Maribacter sp.]